jgi:hypothetical protein
MAQAELDAAWDPMTILLLVAATVPKQSPRSQTQIQQENSGSDERHGGIAREILMKVQW